MHLLFKIILYYYRITMMLQILLFLICTTICIKDKIKWKKPFCFNFYKNFTGLLRYDVAMIITVINSIITSFLLGYSLVEKKINLFYFDKDGDYHNLINYPVWLLLIFLLVSVLTIFFIQKGHMLLLSDKGTILEHDLKYCERQYRFIEKVSTGINKVREKLNIKDTIYNKKQETAIIQNYFRLMFYHCCKDDLDKYVQKGNFKPTNYKLSQAKIVSFDMIEELLYGNHSPKNRFETYNKETIEEVENLIYIIEDDLRLPY